MEKINGFLFLNEKDIFDLFDDRKPISTKVKKVQITNSARAIVKKEEMEKPLASQLKFDFENVLVEKQEE